MKIIFAVCIVCLACSLYSADLVQVKEHNLNNGLRVLFVEDHNTPLVVCRLYYKVGSVCENIGKTGLSHMLEHMMFKGTKKVGVSDFAKEQAYTPAIDSLFLLADAARDQDDTVHMALYKKEAEALVEKQRQCIKNNELWSLYQKEGGTNLNAYTSNLMTAYIVTLPSNKIELFMWLESDRMANPVMREFYTERDVVMEERRLRYENSPYGRYYESLDAMIYEAHPYRIPTIGYMSDLLHLTRTDAFNHFKTYYVPNNAIIVFVGDVREDKLMAMVEKYFGPVAPGSTPIKNLVTVDPDPVGQRRLVVKKDVAPVVDIIFKTPALGHPDIYTMDVIEGVLNKESGRLYKRLVNEQKMATNVSAGNYVTKYISTFQIHVSLKNGVSHGAAEKIVLAELEKLKKEPISVRELEKVKNTVTAAEINGLRSNEGLADRLAYYEVCGSWKLINEFADNVKKVTRDQVREAAKKYFSETNMVVGAVANTPGARQ
ncbi:MAG: hypothetical protein A2268_00840 [Candidatus Raymondbacteria bacterium RifOxyA12_full_50_37]|uniref:Peptidase M16 n=1 Tax=Candidatus Raymondbacteria bacterium RIFOXYD12_FULL_49_13 TaxID=1817890 RepID=A0A1F7F215_UNCRA|nr:MAG: hypothetical protein A2268_00840 [Candidatus Raymondbacteria bacterium RifOxyA12_full_50_37]OGJ90074.1 MAG: hypothetical protein A2248_19165 [Candidatus Raymondbacteria bacterium RIFOXYA2_FULL_49_16]OGJ96716.1 MAG: hypothetical protein A2350_02025 [Candidatus Raymondbacteria bacterium RifOxyB12_full_50_8]OGJ96759.1 MAG: hypothetical protein A2453_06295 [Candidatus Raymondbacteria bacterium RIFOXYC2_FULL_50_21]OGK00546.1 MAG: hypothetical protein A2519_21740 [Candidatus Raymondbacteria b